MRPGVRVGLLELVGRAVDGELPHLGERAALVHVARTATVPPSAVARRCSSSTASIAADSPIGHLPGELDEPALEVDLEAASLAEQRSAPTPTPRRRPGSPR